jgi:HSP20 family protein
MPRRDPFKDIEALFEQLNTEFTDMSSDFGKQTGVDIHVDVADTGDKLIVSADVPGFDSSEIDVSVKDRQLTIAAEHSESAESDADDTHYYRRERTTRAATRTLTLPTEVDESATSASYDNGVLTIELPKRDTEDGGVDIEVN